MQMTPFNPQPGYESQVASKRTLNFLHPVKEKVMFAPEAAGCNATEHLYLFNRDEVLLEREVLFYKIPYGDHFKFRSFYHLKGRGSSCVIDYGYLTIFVKKTVWQGKIESSSKSEIRNFGSESSSPNLKQKPAK